MELIKRVKPKHPTDQETYTFMGEEGFLEEIDNLGEVIEFSVGLVTDLFDDDQLELSPENALIQLQEANDHNQKVMNIISALGKDIIIEKDYYWSEMSVNLRIYVPLTHNLVSHEQ